MLKKFFASFMLSIGVLATAHQAAAEGGVVESRVVMAKNVVKNQGPNNLTKDFSMGDKVFAYFTYKWDEKNPPQKLYARWYNCNKLVGAAMFVPNARKNPHNVWFWIDSNELGSGDAAVAVYADGKLEQTERFNVRTAQGEPGACQSKQPEIIEMSADALFAFGKSGPGDINNKGRGDLQALATNLNKMYSSIETIRVVGHTDRIGSESANLALSQRRAETIRGILQSMNAPASSIIANGVGSSAPKTSCSSSLPRTQLIACLAPDRRVEIQITGQKR